MGKIILGLAAPHNPNITSRPEKISVEVQGKLDSAFGHLKKQLSETSPDCLLILTSDHVTNFFYNNAPMFCLGVSDTCTGPAPKEMAELRIPRATLKVDTTMAKGLLDYGIESGIDFSYSREMILDHAFMVPLSLLTPHMDLPIVPLACCHPAPPRRAAIDSVNRSATTSAITTTARSPCSRAAVFPATSAAPRWARWIPRWIWSFSTW